MLKDKVLCPALIDRLCHKSHLVNKTETFGRERFFCTFAVLKVLCFGNISWYF
ncbi:MAG: hypothetical protein J6S56_01525 [Bacteroidales bacterium]|nr:hypothetical protein [Bacteroidales bacterium]